MLNLTSADVRVGQSAKNKSQALELVCSVLAQNHKVKPDYLVGMQNREKQFTTYLDNGIAIPHGTTDTRDSVLETGVAVVQFPEGVWWSSENGGLGDVEPGTGDGEWVYVAFGIAAKGDEHLGILKQISHLVGEEEDAEKLKEAKTAEELLSLLGVAPAQAKPPVPRTNLALISEFVFAEDLVGLVAVNAANLVAQRRVKPNFLNVAASQQAIHIKHGVFFQISTSDVLETSVALARPAAPFFTKVNLGQADLAGVGKISAQKQSNVRTEEVEVKAVVTIVLAELSDLTNFVVRALLYSALVNPALFTLASKEQFVELLSPAVTEDSARAEQLAIQRLKEADERQRQQLAAAKAKPAQAEDGLSLEERAAREAAAALGGRKINREAPSVQQQSATQKVASQAQAYLQQAAVMTALQEGRDITPFLPQQARPNPTQNSAPRPVSLGVPSVPGVRKPLTQEEKQALAAHAAAQAKARWEEQEARKAKLAAEAASQEANAPENQAPAEASSSQDQVEGKPTPIAPKPLAAPTVLVPPTLRRSPRTPEPKAEEKLEAKAEEKLAAKAEPKLDQQVKPQAEIKAETGQPASAKGQEQARAPAATPAPKVLLKPALLTPVTSLSKPKAAPTTQTAVPDLKVEPAQTAQAEPAVAAPANANPQVQPAIQAPKPKLLSPKLAVPLTSLSKPKPAVEVKDEAPAAELKVEAPTPEVKIEAPAAEVKVEAPTTEVKVEAPAAEVKVPAAEVKVPTAAPGETPAAPAQAPRKPTFGALRKPKVFGVRPVNPDDKVA